MVDTSELPLLGIHTPTQLWVFTLCGDRLWNLDGQVQADGVFLNFVRFNLNILGNFPHRWQDARGHSAAQ